VMDPELTRRPGQRARAGDGDDDTQIVPGFHLHNCKPNLLFLAIAVHESKPYIEPHVAPLFGAGRWRPL
jgi:hypothetical protein